MRRILDKGTTFVKSEQQRVSQILGGKISEKKLKELNLRLNVLKAFESTTVDDKKQEL